MPVITAQMSKEEKEVVYNMLTKASEGSIHPVDIRKEAVVFIEDLMHKSFSEGMLYNSE